MGGDDMDQSDESNAGWYINNRTAEASNQPQWAKDLVSHVKKACNESAAASAACQQSVEELVSKMGALESKVDVHDERINANDERMFELEEKVEALSNKVTFLEGALAKEADNNARATLKFVGIPQIGREKWPETERKLATFLAEHSTVSAAMWQSRFTRGHHGNSDPDSPIHCLFESWRWPQEVRVIFAKKGHKIKRGDNDVYCNDHYSTWTYARRAKAFLKRKDIRKANPLWKVKVAYPAHLMKKAPTDEAYVLIQAF